MISRMDKRGATVRKHAAEIDVEINDRKLAETLLAGENRLLEMVAKGEPLPSILDGICRLV